MNIGKRFKAALRVLAGRDMVMTGLAANAAATSVEGSVRPLAVCAPGRSGTTFLMQLLLSSPQVVFEPHYPYERRYLAYFERMASLLGGEFRPQGRWDNAAVVAQPWDGTLKPLPFRPQIVSNDRLQTTALQRLWAGFASLLEEEHSDRVQELESKPLYYAEKVPLQLASRMRSVFPLRVLHLVRDPRDILLSQIAFCRKKGVNAFGWNPEMSQADFARFFAPRQKGRLGQLAMLQETDYDQLIRYEDLIVDLERQVERLSTWLGIELSGRDALSNSAAYTKHRTAPEEQGSVYRWQKELEPEAAAVFEETIGKELSELNYPI